MAFGQFEIRKNVCGLEIETLHVEMNEAMRYRLPERRKVTDDKAHSKLQLDKTY